MAHVKDLDHIRTWGVPVEDDVDTGAAAYVHLRRCPHQISLVFLFVHLEPPAHSQNKGTVAAQNITALLATVNNLLS